MQYYKIFFVNNNTDYCGGFAVESVATQTILNFINATITNNIGAFGGALLDYGEISNIQVTQSTIANNIAIYNGGGAELYLSGFTFISTNFYNNTAINGTGGALDLQDVFSYKQLTLINCTIQGNYAPIGGAISILFAYANLNIQNSIISKNKASQQAGGIYISTDSVLTVTVLLTNTTIINNSISTGCEQDIICSGSATINLGLNKCGNGNNCTLPLADCNYGCSGDICSCSYSSISHCTPLTICPASSHHPVSSHHAVSSIHHKSSNNNKPSTSSTSVAIIAAASTVGAAAILVGVYFINRKYSITSRIGSSNRSFRDLDNIQN